MWKQLQQLRKRPKAVRNRYAFVGAATFTTVVALLWGVTATMRLTSELSQPAAARDGAPFFSNLSNGFKDGWEDINAKVEEAKEVVDAARVSGTAATATQPSPQPLPDASSFSVSSTSAAAETHGGAVASTSAAAATTSPATAQPPRGREVRIRTSSATASSGPAAASPAP